MPVTIRRKPMTPQMSNREPQPRSQAVPAFKPVALPALAAALRSTKTSSAKTKTPVPPAILRKEAVLGR